MDTSKSNPIPFTFKGDQEFLEGTLRHWEMGLGFYLISSEPFKVKDQGHANPISATDMLSRSILSIDLLAKAKSILF